MKKEQSPQPRHGFAIYAVAIAVALVLGACPTALGNDGGGGDDSDDAGASTAAEISAFGFAAAANAALSSDITGTVGDATIAANVPNGTDVTALIPTITISDGATVSPASGEAQDFTNPVTYTVTAEDAATTQDYTVTVTETDAVIVGGNVFHELSLAGAVTTDAGAPGHPAHYDGTGAGPLLGDLRYGVVAGDYIYFTEQDNHAIRRLDPQTDTATTFCGTTGTWGDADGAAEVAQFSDPAGLATDGTYLYVADELNHVIRRVALADGSVDTLAGSGTSGFADGNIASAQFHSPMDLCYHDGVLYVADEWNYRIRTVDLATDTVSTLAGTGDWNHQDGTGTDPVTGAEFYNPRAIAFDGTDLWVTDYQTVRRVTFAGEVETMCGMAGTAGYRDDLGTAARFHEPNSIVAQPGMLYIGDANNDAIRKIDTATTEVTTLAGDYQNAGVEDGTHTAARFDWPCVLGLIDSNLFASDYSGQTLRMVDVDTRAVTTIAGTPYEDHDADSAGYFIDGSGVGALCESVHGATTDGEHLYFTERSANLIRKMDLQTGAVTTLAGDYQSGGSADGTGAAARFNWPKGITVLGGSLYVCDSSNNTIREIAIATGDVSTVAGTAGTSGSDDGDGTTARFYSPTGITTDGTNLYVTDELNHTIRKVGLDTGEVTTYSGAPGTPGYVNDTGSAARFSGPTAMACDGAALYVSDGNEVRRIDLDDASVTLVAGNTGSSDWADGSGLDARFHNAWGLVCDGEALWVMDSWNHVIRRVE